MNGLETALDEMVKSIEKEVDKGANIVLLTDRGVSNFFAPIPMLWPVLTRTMPSNV